jgi:Mrp family chromosome partitioning ATPase
LDSPATLNYADAATIASMVDGVVLVAARGKTSRKDVQKALQQMEKVRARLFGVVFNRSDDADGAHKQS